MKPIRPTSSGVFPYLEDGVHTVALGNMTQFEIMLHRHKGSVWLGVVNKGCYWFSFGPHADYVKEKIKVMEGDAANLADFIACQMSPDPYPFDVQGYYYPNLLADN
jgi:hypothetical protein